MHQGYQGYQGHKGYQGAISDTIKCYECIEQVADPNGDGNCSGGTILPDDPALCPDITGTAANWGCTTGFGCSDDCTDLGSQTAVGGDNLTSKQFCETISGGTWNPAIVTNRLAQYKCDTQANAETWCAGLSLAAVHT